MERKSGPSTSMGANQLLAGKDNQGMDRMDDEFVRSIHVAIWSKCDITQIER